MHQSKDFRFRLYLVSASPNKKENVKKSKTQPFEVNADIMTLIKADSVNEKLWGSVLDKVAEGKQVGYASYV